MTRVAAVTGGCGAIGTALAQRLRDAGHVVVALDLRERVAGVADGLAVDVTDPVTVRLALDELLARHGRLDLLVLAAGVTALGGLADTSEETFRRLMDVNFHGAVHCLRAALPALRDTRGDVVVLSSVAGLAPVVGRPAYVASKHALTGTFESLRPELARDHVGLLMVHPTFVTHELADDNAATTRTTTGRLVTPDDVARGIVRGLARGRRRVLPGRTAWLAHHVHRLAPRVYARLMRQRLRG